MAYPEDFEPRRPLAKQDGCHLTDNGMFLSSSLPLFLFADTYLKCLSFNQVLTLSIGAFFVCNAT
jgi:hypothetical protein